jgi:hypothetical protein
MLLALLDEASWRELMFLHRCQPTRLGLDESGRAWKTKTKTGFKAFFYSFLLSISLFFTRTGIEVKDSWTYQESFKKKKNNANYSMTTSQPRELQRHIVATMRSATTTRATMPQQHQLQRQHRNTTWCNIIVSCSVGTL